jgi:hypothetical protein
MATFKIGRPFSGYEYTTIEAESFEQAMEMTNEFYSTQLWEFDPETHNLEEGDIWIRDLDTLEDRTY